MAFDFDLFVIGGGSGGVRCARIAAGHGARVGIAEELHWGGTCVNIGCVPKKILVQASEYSAHAADARGFGWDSTIGAHDWPALITHKNAEIARLNDIYRKLLDGSGVRRFDARATFVGPHELMVGATRVSAARIVIATGGRPTRPTIPGVEHSIVSDQAFFLPDRPARVVMIGGGYISVEFAGIFAGLGSRVDVVMRQELPLRGFDEDMRTGLAEAMAAGGITQHAGVSPVSIRQQAGEKIVELSDGSSIHTDLVFFATGRIPYVDGLGLEHAGVALTKAGAIAVDDAHATSAAHIFAIGDVTDRLNLTPVAIAEGHHLADRLFASHPPRSWSMEAVPTAVFSSPPIATVGITEAQAATRGPHDIYLTSFTPMRHGISRRARRTMMKLVVEQGSNRVVGAHMLGDDAPEMIQGIAIAITAGATKQDFDRTVGIHPTAAEEFVTLRTRTRSVG